MTRGTAYLINNRYIMETQEFNGDMYLNGGKGEDMMNCLLNVNCLKSFKKELVKFNEDNFNYDTQLFYPSKIKDYVENGIIEMSNDNYFKKFFSDWTFWKNISNNDVQFKTRDNQLIVLKPNQQIAINFGRFEGHKLV